MSDPPEQAPLFDILPPPDGPVWESAFRTVRDAVDAGRLELGRDALGIAHLAQLARAMDCTRDARALTLLSRELRAVAESLNLTRTARPPAGAGDPFGFLNLTTDEQIETDPR